LRDTLRPENSEKGRKGEKRRGRKEVEGTGENTCDIKFWLLS